MIVALLDLVCGVGLAGGAPAGAASAGTAPTGIGGISPEAQQTLAHLLLVFGIMVAVVVMLRVWRNRRYKVSELDRDQTARIEEIREQAESRRDHVDRAMSDAEAFGRRLSASMDTQAVRLELLIEEAERAARRLEQALAQAQTRATGATSDAVRSSAEAASPQSAGVQREARVSQSALARARLEQLERERSEQPATTPSSGLDSGRGSGRVSSLREDVFRLADRGLSPGEIAGELDHPQGEVELILNLRRSG